MAYALFSKTFELTLRNSPVSIINKWTGVPAVILENPVGGIVNTQGIAKLDTLARLNVYIDTSQEWVVNVMDGQSVPYNVLYPKQVISTSDFLTLEPEVGKTYVVSEPPYLEYTWDGNNLIPSLSASERYMISVMANPQLTNVVTNGGKLESYTKNGISHTVTYPNPNSVVISNETGVTRNISLDGTGSVLSIV